MKYPLNKIKNKYWFISLICVLLLFKLGMNSVNVLAVN